jgi:hypothetical protein
MVWEGSRIDRCPTKRFTEWRPRGAAWHFGRYGGAAIGELNRSLKVMKPVLIRLLLAVLIALGVSGCLLDYETAITPDPKADPRLEGVWQISKKAPKEVRSDRDHDDIGAYGYIIFAKLDEGTYKGIMFDRFERDSPSKFPEVLVSTRKYQGHSLLLVRRPEYEKARSNEGDIQFKNWLVDYEFNQRGELFLRFLSAEDLDELREAHPMRFEHEDKPFATVTMKGSEEEILKFYGDPKVRALLTSCGKYQKLLQPDNKRSEPDGPANPSQPIRSGTNSAPAAAGSRR